MPHEHDAEPELAAAHRAAQTEAAGGSPAAATLPAGARPSAGRHVTPGQAIALQRAAGNRATATLLGRPDQATTVQRIWPEDIPDGDAPATTAPGTTTGIQPNPAGAPPDGGSGSGGAPNGSGGGQPTPPPPSGQAPAPPTLTKPTGSGPQPPTPAPAPSGQQPAPTGSGGGTPDGGTPAVQPPPAPTPATPPGPGQVPDPNTAHSGIDFGSWTFADVYKVGRPALEMARVIPGWGLLAGAATDAITMETDLESVPSGDYPVTTALIGIRDAAALLNNAIGHVLYVDQLVQDGLAGSVIGIEFTPLTAEVNETLTSAKAVIDGLLVFGDVAIMVGASWNQSHADPNQSAAWQNIINSAAANLLGDAFGTIIDLISMASAGAANTEPVLKGSQFFGTAASLARSWKGVLLAWVQSIWNIWGGDILGSASSSPAPASAPAAQRLEGGPDTQNALLAAALSGAAGIMQTESASGRLAYTAIDAGITELEAEAAQQMAQMDAICQQLTGGKTIWQVIHDGAMSGIAKMREEVAGLQHLEAGATDAKANALQVRAGVDAAIAQVNALQVPSVHIPQANLGDGALASAASTVLNAVGSVADSGLQVAVDGVRSAVTNAKSEALGPLQSVGAHADEIGEFLALTAEVAGRETGVVQGKITDFESGLARCDGFESAIDLLVGGFTDAAGLPRVTIQDLRDLWASVPGQFDRVDALAASLQQRAAGLSGGGSDAGGGGGPVAAPPPPPDGGSQ